MSHSIEKLTQDTIKKGGVLAKLFFAIDGNSKETIQNLSAGFIQTLLKEPGVISVLGEIDEPVATGDVFSSSIEAKVLVSDFQSLARICATYSPISLEIQKPDSIHLKLNEVHDLLLFISTTTFDYKRHILTKISSKDELEVYKKTLENRLKLGEKILSR